VEVYKFLQTDGLVDIDTMNSIPFSSEKPKNKNSYNDWRKLFKNQSDNVAEPYFPCKHPGYKCEKSTCGCIDNKTGCEKYCHCSVDCSYRYPGCICKHDCKSQLCPCFKKQRECDPDLCRECGAGKPEPYYRNCKNVEIQYHENAETLIARSTITANAKGEAINMWGLFTKENIEKDALISEYCGEIISIEDGEKRGILYDTYKMSYIFKLNSGYDVDATWKGNNIRFANHSNSPNCYSNIFLVNGDHRIGIYAKRDIEAGEELFFNYSDSFKKQHEDLR